MIELQRDGAFFTLTLCNGDNRFTSQFIEHFGRRLDEVLAQAGDGPAALIVTGQGKFWSNGIDLEALSSAPAAEQRDFVPALHALLGRLVTFPLPTAATLNGHCFAGGAVLAMAFDYRLMRADRGWYCLPEVDLGMQFPQPMLSLLTHKLRPEVLRDAILGGRRYTAPEALAAGLVDDICAQDALPALAQQTLGPLAAKGRTIFARFKHDLYGARAREFGFPPDT